MAWISVRDRHPETGEYSIVSTEHGVGMAAYNRREGFNNIRLAGRIQLGAGANGEGTVTHWMPFPDKAPSYIEINAETRFDYSIRGQQLSFTMAELEQIYNGHDIIIVAPGWQTRESTGLRLPNPGPGSNGNVMGVDYMYRWKNGELTDRLPMQSSDDV
ncbi:DUF551 domain-containing protein [Enterobacter hormaechei]|nr:DUF551 domain-containing protein [Enterobacter hormaechei]